jgi:high-affinity iron transporter
MIQSTVITLREGLEAFLIVAISLAYLRKSGRVALLPAVYWGIGISLGVSALAGVLLQRAANEALWEGILALVAAVLVATLTVHMWRVGKHMRRQIHQRLESSASRLGRGAWWGVFGFTVLMISREGMETAVLFNALIFQVRSLQLIAGAVLGVCLAAGLAVLWSRYGHRVNLALFLQVSAVFLLLFVAQLFISGFHELTEANVLPYSEPLHWATEPYGPDGRYGKLFSYLLVVVPSAWLGIAALRSRRPEESPTESPAS